MRPRLKVWLRCSLAAAALAGGSAGAAPLPPPDTCRLYGYLPGTRDYAVCRMNVWHLWNTGPCSDARFAAMHLRYCHLIPPLDF
jgi:hypothetical protein